MNGTFNPHEYSDNEFDDDEEAEYNDYHNKSKDQDDDAEELYENVELARQVLKNRRLNEGMTKTDAVQLLVRHNIK